MISKLNYKSHQILGLQSILQYPIISFLKTQLHREIFPDQNKSKTIRVMLLMKQVSTNIIIIIRSWLILFKGLTGLLLLFITDLFYLSDVTFMWVMFQKQFSIGQNFLHLRALPVQHNFSFGIILIICLSFHFGTIWNNGTNNRFSEWGEVKMCGVDYPRLCLLPEVSKYSELDWN